MSQMLHLLPMTDPYVCHIFLWCHIGSINKNPSFVSASIYHTYMNPRGWKMNRSKTGKLLRAGPVFLFHAWSICSIKWGVSIKWIKHGWTPSSLDGLFQEKTPTITWMMTGGTSIYGNPYLYIYIYIYINMYSCKCVVILLSLLL